MVPQIHGRMTQPGRIKKQLSGFFFFMNGGFRVKALEAAVSSETLQYPGCANGTQLALPEQKQLAVFSPRCFFLVNLFQSIFAEQIPPCQGQRVKQLLSFIFVRENTISGTAK